MVIADLAWLAAVLIVAGVVLLRRFRRRPRRPPPPIPASVVPAEAAAEPLAPLARSSGAPAPVAPAAPPEITTPGAAAVALRGDYDDAAHPSALLGNPRFERGVELFCDARRYGAPVLADAGRGDDPVLAFMALEALSRRPDRAGAAQPLLDALPAFWSWYRFFALRALAAMEGAVLGAVVARLHGPTSWIDGLNLPMLREFVRARTARGDHGPLGDALAALSRAQIDAVAQAIEALTDILPPALRQEFRDWQARYVDLEALRKIGKVWGDEEVGDAVFLVDTAPAVVTEMASALGTGRGGLVLLGEPGVGKTSLIRVLARRLRADGWHFFEATAGDLLAGQTYIGQLEGRVQELVRAVAGKRVVWVVPGVHELLWAGTHRLSPTGVLDLVLPHVERGDLRLLGETTPSAFVRLTEARPSARTILRAHRAEALDEAATLALARGWVTRHARTALDDQALREALQLVRQYLSDKAMPGNLLHLLEVTRVRLAEGRPGPLPSLTLDDLRLTLSRLTGLPVSILDDRAELDLAALRALFERRVIGQAEAVDCLVERVAMIKAGLTDASRPQGVFMFVGPTGTGKTEIAKTLAEFLFGSADRMIRLDMSELQTADALDRLLGTADLAGGHALVDLVRRQPFSVILLDEFEKANPYVWNLFLQLFDDGRLTDRRGVTADFRHCIVIMTSNLGAAVPSGPGLGFAAEAPRFASGTVERALGQVFRPEFVNRIDRIVVFRPLDRAVMRRILRKELDDVLNRRGLRSRTWAVEWDESAVDFLLEKGFTPDLGARPLKRAIERYLLSPLALTIVNRQAPAGDQFLFVRSDGERIEVAFVDPDAPEPDVAPPAASPPTAGTGALRIEEMVRDPRGVRAEVAALDAAYRRVAARLQSADWQGQRAAALAETHAAGFWESPARFAALGRAEYLDRFESGLEAAGSLLRRLRGSGSKDRDRLPRDMVQRLAQLLFLMETACEALAKGRPRDAFLSVTAGRDPGGDPGLSDGFARRLGAMYTAWARTRRMRFEVLDEAAGDGTTPYRLLLAVSGFAAFAILEAESGLHVLESPQEPRSFQRVHARVTVAAQPDEPADGADGLRAQARGALAAEAASTPAVVRSYREEPSPLVRDRVRGWRTGRLDRVLAGNFDVI